LKAPILGSKRRDEPSGSVDLTLGDRMRRSATLTSQDGDVDEAIGPRPAHVTDQLYPVAEHDEALSALDQF
jgi:hypothetical protein